ncbi:uncharacterized protein LOC141688070 [Apium graveolens]|uniref:uncharacterized protein LOC141688070 n=1 Tax=Apium graveolens TaxID=4045 RepID=UPI003D7AD704
MSGGLAVLWKNNVNCRVIGSSINHIDIHIVERNVPVWRLTCYYGFSERARRHDAWNMLRQLAQVDGLPWFIFGDFNDLLYASDKSGKHAHPLGLLDGFRAAVEDYSLTELELTRGEFTWEKGKGTDNWQFRFRFENVWLKEPSFYDEVSTFLSGIPTIQLLPKLLLVSSFMAKWGRNFFHKFRDKVKKQKEVIDGLINRVDEDGVRSYFIEKYRLDDLMKQEEAYWQQRAKTIWLSEGDTNSKKFHAQALMRKKVNRIDFLRNDQDEIIDN